MADVLVPDMGSDDPVDLAEILVKVGDQVKVEDSLVVVESAKASLEVPAPSAGTVSKIHVKVGQSLNKGDLLLTLDDADEKVADKANKPIVKDKSNQKPQDKSTQADSIPQDADQAFNIPDIGGDAADVIELSLKPGDQVKKDQTLVVLESAKATIEVPSEVDGILVQYNLNVGDSVSEGDALVVLTVDQNSQSPSSQSTVEPNTEMTSEQAVLDTDAAPDSGAKKASSTKSSLNEKATIATTSNNLGLDVNVSTAVHAGPAVRRLANELGVILSKVSPTGPRGRILKEDIHQFIKIELTRQHINQEPTAGLAALPSVDFSQFGDIKEIPLTKIQNMSAKNLHRAWVNIPHVTQFDEADITDLEEFRKSLGAEYKENGIKITMLAFMIKASTLALKVFPKFNSSLHSDGKTLIQKNYCHIGFAADTPFGLVVPVIKNADQLSVVEIAQQLGELSAKARDKKLAPREMQGGCFSISSLGGIGGTAFTPIVNWPEVAILGVSRAKIQPVWTGTDFKPRLVLPLALSYDHRVIDGADAARFGQYLVKLLSDSRRMLL